MKLRIGAFAVLLIIGLWMWLSSLVSGQTQDSINATAAERIANNVWRIAQVEARLGMVEEKLSRLNWVLGMLSTQILIKLLELWHKRPGHHTPPPSIRERRAAPWNDHEE